MLVARTKGDVDTRSELPPLELDVWHDVADPGPHAEDAAWRREAPTFTVSTDPLSYSTAARALRLRSEATLDAQRSGAPRLRALSDPVFAEIFANVSQMPTRDGVRFISELVMAEQLPTMVYVKGRW